MFDNLRIKYRLSTIKTPTYVLFEENNNPGFLVVYPSKDKKPIEKYITYKSKNHHYLTDAFYFLFNCYGKFKNIESDINVILVDGTAEILEKIYKIYWELSDNIICNFKIVDKKYSLAILAKQMENKDGNV